MDYKEFLEKESTKLDVSTKDLISELEKLLNSTSLKIDNELIVRLKNAKNDVKVFGVELLDLHENLGHVMVFVEENKFSDNRMVAVESNKRIIVVLDKLQKSLTTTIDRVAHKLQEMEKELDVELTHDNKCSCGNCKH